MEPIKVANNWWEYIKEHPNFAGCLIDKDNYIVWYKNGKMHREDGPAFEYVNGDKEWWLNGDAYREQEHKIATRKIKLERVLKNIH